MVHADENLTCSQCPPPPWVLAAVASRDPEMLVSHLQRCPGYRKWLALVEKLVGEAGPDALAISCDQFILLSARPPEAPRRDDDLVAEYVHIVNCAACRAMLMEEAAVTGDAFCALPPASETDRCGVDELGVVPFSRYERVRLLASGGMGQIWELWDRQLGRRVVAKQPLITNATTAAERRSLFARLEHEARITARLDHPAIVAVHEAGRWPTKDPFFVMRYVAGVQLDAAIAQRQGLTERMELLPSVIAVAEAVAYAHQKRIIHRDLKPQNVLVGGLGDTVVVDWGLARDLDAPDAAPLVSHNPGRRPATLTEAGWVMGTPAYMAPEQAHGEVADERTDVYALGAILYHVLGGQMPYGSHDAASQVFSRLAISPPRPLSALAPRAAQALVSIVDRAMARNPRDRYDNAHALVKDLQKFRQGQLVAAHDYTLGELLTRWVRRHRAVVAVALLATATTAITTVTSVREIKEHARNAERSARDANAAAELAARQGAEAKAQASLADNRKEEAKAQAAAAAREAERAGLAEDRYRTQLDATRAANRELDERRRAQELLNRQLQAAVEAQERARGELQELLEQEQARVERLQWHLGPPSTELR